MIESCPFSEAKSNSTSILIREENSHSASTIYFMEINLKDSKKKRLFTTNLPELSLAYWLESRRQEVLYSGRADSIDEGLSLNVGVTIWRWTKVVLET